MSYLLSIETGLGAASLALLQDGQCIATAEASSAHANATETLPLAEGLLHNASIGFGDIEAFICGIGPGSFTGIRIGLALARGLALATNKPLIGINTLEATAYAASLASNHHGEVLVALDAMRGQLYTQRFSCAPGTLPQPLEDAALRDAAQCAAWVAGAAADAAFAGNAEPILSQWLERDLASRWLGGIAHAAMMGALGAAYHQAGTSTPRHPLYVRAPDAKLPTKPPVLPAS
jgi:tRNA threonylcarbamoyladenosine biosynthesis protein TsaB